MAYSPSADRSTGSSKVRWWVSDRMNASITNETGVVSKSSRPARTADSAHVHTPPKPIAQTGQASRLGWRRGVEPDGLARFQCARRSTDVRGPVGLRDQPKRRGSQRRGSDCRPGETVSLPCANKTPAKTRLLGTATRRAAIPTTPRSSRSWPDPPVTGRGFCRCTSSRRPRNVRKG